jgi:hypothetical protein
MVECRGRDSTSSRSAVKIFEDRGSGQHEVPSTEAKSSGRNEVAENTQRKKGAEGGGGKETNLQSCCPILLEDPLRRLVDNLDVLRSQLLQVPNHRVDLFFGVVLRSAHSADVKKSGSAEGERVVKAKRDKGRRGGAEDNVLLQKLDSRSVHIFAVVEVEKLTVLLQDRMEGLSARREQVQSSKK